MCLEPSSLSDKSSARRGRVSHRIREPVDKLCESELAKEISTKATDVSLRRMRLGRGSRWQTPVENMKYGRSLGLRTIRSSHLRQSGLAVRQSIESATTSAIDSKRSEGKKAVLVALLMCQSGHTIAKVPSKKPQLAMVCDRQSL